MKLSELKQIIREEYVNVLNEGKDEAEALAKLLKNKINVPYKHVSVSTLGGNDKASVILKISLSSPDEWSNGIFQNSKYAMFMFKHDGTIENFNGRIGKKMRKTKFKTSTEALLKVQKFIDIVSKL